MKKLLFAVCFLLVLLRVHAQDDSLRSPFSVYGGAGLGTGLLLGHRELPLGYDDLQFDDGPFLDLQFKAGVLWNEQYGITVLAGQIKNTGDGDRFATYAADGQPGYRLLFEYSDLHFGYTYRYVNTMFAYRFGREPFNITLNGGVGFGRMHNANGIAIYQKNGSNDFLEVRYYADPTVNMNVAVGADFAYMRQLSQHWFMNTGVNVSYTNILQNYEMVSTTQYSGQQFSLASPSHITGMLHHAAIGLFVHFQWNEKESERAFYE
jgi:hypothetical protein